VNGFRYNARVLVRHLAGTHFGIEQPAPRLGRDDVVPFLLRELTSAPELWIQKGYLARVVGLDQPRDEGVQPLAHFIDEAGPPAVAATVELDREGTIVPVVYHRRDGRIDEHVLPSHPLRSFDTDEHRAALEAALGTGTLAS
jgi:hypothetical protein